MGGELCKRWSRAATCVTLGLRPVFCVSLETLKLSIHLFLQQQHTQKKGPPQRERDRRRWLTMSNNYTKKNTRRNQTKKEIFPSFLIAVKQEPLISLSLCSLFDINGAEKET